MLPELTLDSTAVVIADKATDVSWFEPVSCADDAEAAFIVDLPPLVAEHIGTAINVTVTQSTTGEIAHLAKNARQSSEGRGTPGKGASRSRRSSEDVSAGQGRSQQQQKQKIVKLEEGDLDENWYLVLKLIQEDAATPEEIKAAFRQRCLETHPDKQPNRSDVEFKKVSRAFEILGNEDIKRTYDSSRPFDDSIPEDKAKLYSTDDKFFGAFRPVFNRNLKWSVLKDAPPFGDSDTPVEDIDKFYTWWMGFKSWRDFAHEVTDELYDLESASCREERRMMERENKKMVDNLRKDELKRVRTLTERAKKFDPRLKRHQDKLEQEREDHRKAKEEARQKKQDEAIRAAAQAKQQQADAEAEKKRAIEANKQQLRAEYGRLTSVLKAHELEDNIKSQMLFPDKIRTPNLQWLFNQLSKAPEAAAMVDKLVEYECTPGSDGAVPIVLELNRIIQEKELAMGRNRMGEPIRKDGSTANAKEEKKRAAAAKTVGDAVWEDKDIILLQKAIIQFPPGTVDRWRRIQAFMHNEFTEEQVLAKVKTLETAWQKDKSMMKQSSPTIKKGDDGEAPQALDRVGVASAPAAPTADDPADWTQKQQRQLEEAIRAHKDYKEKDKWIRIAKAVDGKSAKQSFDRYKYLCSLNKK